ncbi:MAG: hypothetical protein ACM3ZB_16180 [bacterium]
MRSLSVCLWLLTAAIAQEQHLITAIATNRSTGKAVGGLTANDLEMVQDGQSFRAASVRTMDGPKDILFVIDNNLPLVRQSLTAGIRIAEYEFGPEDRAGIVAFSRKPKLEVPLTGDVRLVLRRLDGITRSRDMRVSKQHALYDAILLGVQNLPERSLDRVSHIVVFTMLAERQSKANAAEVVAAATNRRVVIDGIVLAPKYLAQETKRQLGLDAVAADDGLRALSKPTGGESRIEEPSGYLLRQALLRIRSRLQVAGTTQEHGPVGLRLTAEGKIKYPDLEFRILSDEVSPAKTTAGVGERQ